MCWSVLSIPSKICDLDHVIYPQLINFMFCSASVPIFNRCVPEVAKGDGILDVNQNWNFVSYFFGNLYASWLQIAIIVAFSFCEYYHTSVDKTLSSWKVQEKIDPISFVVVLVAVVLLLLFAVPKIATWLILIFACLISIGMYLEII